MQSPVPGVPGGLSILEEILVNDDLRRWLPWIGVAVVAIIVIAIIAVNQGDDDDEAAADTTTTVAEETTTTEGETTTTAGETTTTEGETTTTEAETTTTEAVQITGRGDGVLTLGRVLPETGFLDHLGGPMIAGVSLAVEDINAAGGVLGADVGLLEFDSGTDPAVATPNVNSGLAQGADVIIGAAASGVTQSFLDTLNQNGVPNCSTIGDVAEFQRSGECVDHVSDGSS